MKRFLFSAISLAFITIGANPAKALDWVYETREIEAEETVSLSAAIDESGVYTMKVSSRTGDPDLYIFNEATGDQIAARDAIGDDRLSLELATGKYVFVVRMASCAQASGRCSTDISVGRRLDSGLDRIDFLESCIRELTGYGDIPVRTSTDEEARETCLLF